MKKILFITVAFFMASLFFTSCEKEDITIEEPSVTDVLEDVDQGEIVGVTDSTIIDSSSVESRSCVTGALSATFNNVAAYKNCPMGSSNTYGNSYVNGVYVGKKWQCVEYVQRYYKVIYNMNIKPYFGNANTFWYNNLPSSSGLVKYLNGAVAPQVGDILVSISSGVGHVAIVRGVSSSKVYIIDQNFSSSSARELSRNGNMIGAFSSAYTVKSIVRKAQQTPASTPTLLTPAANAINLNGNINFAWSCPNGTEYRVQIIESSKYQGFSSSNGFSGTMAFNNNLGNTTSFVWTQPQPGKTYYWTVRANNSGGASVFAPKRTFTTASGSGGNGSGPDLVVQNQSGPTVANKGSYVSVSCKVKNVGSSNASSSRVKYYLSTNTSYSSNDFYLDYDNVGSLSPNGYNSESEGFYLPSNISSGNWYILFRADANSQVSESNESNNVVYKSIHIN